MKIVFFGTPDYVVPILDSLHKKFRARDGTSPIVAVVTQKPKPSGRKKILTYSPTDKWAFEKKIPVVNRSQDLIKENIKADIGILESYGEILSKEIINYFPHGILNIHPSLLPRWRGASPVQATLVSGDIQTGGTAIKLDEKVDHGPIVTQFKEEILPDDTTESLRTRIFARSGDVLIELLEPYLMGKIKLKPQDDDKATFTTQIIKDHAFIQPECLNLAREGKSVGNEVWWEIPFIKDFKLEYAPENIERFIRAMNPWPQAWTRIKLGSGKDTKQVRMKLLKAHVDEGKLVLDEVQLEGKNPVNWKQLIGAYPNLTF